MEDEKIKQLNEISSCVNKRDMEIWKNVSYATCMKKECEKLEQEIARIKRENIAKRKENQMLEEALMKVNETLEIERETLRVSHQAGTMQKVFCDSLDDEAAAFREKYAKTLQMYEEELAKQRAFYENSSQRYKNLKALQIEGKKLKVEKMMLDAKIASVERSHREYKKIQEMIFHTTVVKFAEFYVAYHRRQKLELEAKEKEKERQRLIQQQQLSEQHKEKTISDNSTSLNDESINTIVRNETVKENPEETFSEFEQFLNEVTPSFSLTSTSNYTVVPAANQQKVRILDVKTVKPALKPTQNQTKIDLRKSMETAMKNAKTKARGHFSLPSANVSQEPRENQNMLQKVDSSVSNQHPQINTSQRSQKLSQSEKKILSQTETKISTAEMERSPKVNLFDAPKPSQESVSKFFSTKKKSVSFQQNSDKENNFMFSEENTNNFEMPKNLNVDIFPNSEVQHKNEQIATDNSMHSEVIPSEDLPEMNSNGHNIFGGFNDTSDGNYESALTSFSPEASFNQSFVEPPFQKADTSEEEPTGFNFFGAAQTKTKNPFSFF